MSTYRSLQVIQEIPDFKKATKLIDQPLREPKATEVRIKVAYTGCNATDLNLLTNRYGIKRQIPFGTGLEALGVIDALGSSYDGALKVGQPVLVSAGLELDGFSEYLYREKSAFLFPLPELDPKYLVTFVNGLTAAIGLDRAGRLQKGEKVLVTAAAGGTGQIVVQWAKHLGAEVVALTSSEEKATYLKKLGADHVINYKKEDLDKTLKEKFPNGLDVIWETIGGETFKVLFEHLAQRGRMVIIGSITTYKTEGFSSVPIENLSGRLLTGSKSLNGFILSDYTNFYPEYLPKLIGLFKENKFVAKVDQGESAPEGTFFGLDNAWRAEEWLHSGSNLGKVVVKVQNI